MKQCVDCGKSGLFLYLDENGRCSECAETTLRRDEELYNNACTFHDELVLKYRQIPDEYDVHMSEKIEFVADAISSCNEFLRLLNKNNMVPMFNKALAANIQKSSTEYRHDGFGISFWSSDLPLSQQKISQKLQNKVEEKQTKFQKLLKFSQGFSELVNKIPRVPIDIEESAQNIPRSRSTGDITASNLTKSSTVLQSGEYIVVDTETTGLAAVKDEIIQLCAVRFSGFMPVDCWISYIKPLKHIPESATSINGISDNTVQNAPSFDAIRESFANYLDKGVPIVGHNVGFDMGFLSSYCFDLGRRRFYDTCSLARTQYAYPKNTLDYLCRVKIPIIRDDAHDALSDSLACGYLFRQICLDKNR